MIIYFHKDIVSQGMKNLSASQRVVNPFLVPSLSIKSAPTKSATDLFIIHQGIKLGIEKEKEDWYQVSLPDGKKGWLPKERLEEI